MIYLLDVNVLLALIWPNHVHHDAAKSWFRTVRDRGWATCPFTEAGFVRISCIPSVTDKSITAAEAILLLHDLRGKGDHTFWPADRSITTLARDIAVRIQGHQQVTDAVLLSLARQRGGRLATLDARLPALQAANGQDSIFVLPV